MMGYCLEGVRVLDLTRVLAGPFCTALLGDLGAEIIKIETPQGDDYRHLPPFEGDTGGIFHLLNRGKSSVALDLRSKRGREIVRHMARHADVLVENFRPGVMADMGLEPEMLAAENPRLVHVSISGFGQNSPMGNLPAYDLVIQAMTGFMSVSGEPDGPPMMTGESVADLTAGLYASWSVLAALLARERSGQGQHIDVAMFDCLFSFLPAALAQHLYGTAPPTRVGNRHPLGAPFGVFAARDAHFTIAVLNPRQFTKLVAAIDRPELSKDPRFCDNSARKDNHAALKMLIENWAATRDVADIVAMLQASDVPCSSIVSVAEAAASAQVAERGLLRQVKDPNGRTITTMAQPIRFSAIPRPSAAAAPRLGADGANVLSDLLGMSAADISDLERAGILIAPSLDTTDSERTDHA